MSNFGYQQEKEKPRDKQLAKKGKIKNPFHSLFVTDFNQCSKQIKHILMKYWHVLQSETMLEKILSLALLDMLQTYRSHTRDALVRSFKRPNATIDSHSKGSFGCSKCSHCHPTTDCKYSKHPLTGEKFNNRHFSNFDSTNQNVNCQMQ